jgi:segregation and condensation protein B
MENLKNIIDSLLFVAEETLSLDRLKKILPQAEAEAIREAVAALQAEYDARPGGFYLAEVAGGYQFRSRPEYTPWIRRMVDPKPLRLSKAAMETLAVIAYKQPIIRADIEHIRGVDCGGVLRVLLERKLVRVLGRKEIAGRPLIYATTKTFLETFDLKDLHDLPSPKEIEEFGKPPLEMRGRRPRPRGGYRRAGAGRRLRGIRTGGAFAGGNGGR